MEVQILSPASQAPFPLLASTPLLQLRTAARVVVRRRSLRGGLGRLDERVVFVVGSPRSGTTFLAACIGSLPGFVDLGEVHAFKAAIAKLARLPPAEAGRRARRLLAWTRRLAFVPSLRPVEQTPEAAFVLPALIDAFPEARFVHALRDGRDVVASLLERGWLSAGRAGADDVGAGFGAHVRFWVEPGREGEFASASDARRAAWAWRRYAGAVVDAGVPVQELRYERMVRDPEQEARRLADFLGVPAGPLAAALGAADARSVGRHERDLSPEQLAEVEAEAGDLLARLAYPVRSGK